jgi:hypothetical protein
MPSLQFRQARQNGPRLFGAGHAMARGKKRSFCLDFFVPTLRSGSPQFNNHYSRRREARQNSGLCDGIKRGSIILSRFFAYFFINGKSMSLSGLSEENINQIKV